MSDKDNYVCCDYHPSDIITIINGLNDYCLSNINLDDKQFNHLFIYIDNFCSDTIRIFNFLSVTPYINYGLHIEYTCFLARSSVFLIAINGKPIYKYLILNQKNKNVSINDIVKYRDQIVALCLKLKRYISTLRIKNNDDQKCIIC